MNEIQNFCPCTKGFTLIELVVVIVVVGILSALGGLIITNHMEGYVAVSRRAKLVDSAESALRRMGRDIQAALPNSIHTWSSADYRGITFLHTQAGGRYRTKCPQSASGCSSNDTLEFNQTDNKFSMIGRLYGGIDSSQIANSRLVIYNTGQSPADAYSSPQNNIATIKNVDYTAGFEDSSNFTISNKRFPYSSPYNRFQIVDAQVRYVWNQNENTLKRYEQNASNITNPESKTSSDWGDGSLIANYVQGVAFDYQRGTSTRSGLLTMNATLSDQGEKITLLHQVHVLNYP